MENYTTYGKPKKHYEKFKPDPNLKLMDQVRQVLRYHHYSFRTEQTYCGWIVDFIKFFNKQRHPKDMGKKDIIMGTPCIIIDKTMKFQNSEFLASMYPQALTSEFIDCLPRNNWQQILTQVLNLHKSARLLQLLFVNEALKLSCRLEDTLSANLCSFCIG